MIVFSEISGNFGMVDCICIYFVLKQCISSKFLGYQDFFCHSQILSHNKIDRELMLIYIKKKFS